MAPPFTLVFSAVSGSSPSILAECQQTAAKASFISKRLDVARHLADLRQRLLDRVGRHGRQVLGLVRHHPVETTVASGSSPSSSAFSRERRPAGRAVVDAGRVAGRDGSAFLAERRRELGEGLHRGVGPDVLVLVEELLTSFLTLTRTGTISSANLPAFCASAARCWLRAAHRSCCSRVVPNSSATLSVPSPMCQSLMAHHSASWIMPSMSLPLPMR